ncbi:hypothetical protein [Roseococcus pinisoli]|uniref:Uncharacterized protein n=1 Tax=Roseococcus pinisoli TaxID=2835040 RepID=A0ABS5QC22_9PROT|nr:hypothetical protein [Roseococcus pinisoli]MBS7811225.1 hypothetical protein [Roseococcus pinisoli]
MSFLPTGPKVPDITISLHWGIQEAAQMIARKLHDPKSGNPPLSPEAVAWLAIGMMADAVTSGAITYRRGVQWMERRMKGEAEEQAELPPPPEVAGRAPWED